MSRLCMAAAWFSVLLIASTSLVATVAGQDLRSTLFSQADELIAQGKEARADVLAPKSWGLGMDRYQSAENKLKAGKNLDDIRKDLNQASGYFKSAIQATELARVTFASVLKAHDDAAKVDAAHNAAQLWNQAQDKFAEAGRKLEDGDVNDARKKGSEAESLFRDAELSAIKTSFFDETRKLLAQADQDRVDRYAPLTLARSRSLLADAEKALNDNRYDTDQPRSLAKEAKYEALHAMYVAKLVKETDDKTITREQLILDGEKPLTAIAGALNLEVGFADGFTKPTDVIVRAIEARDASQDSLTNEIHDRDERIASLTAQVDQLQTKLGGASDAEKALQAQVAAQEEAQRRFARVEQTFTRDEARILRESGNVIIRLVGMSFASGQAVIRPENFALLTKVKDAIALYPDAQIAVEGHTDAYGTEEANLKLSQQRADAVAQYLLANSTISPDRVQAVGYGESRPIATNETQEGRQQNRRIDIVIKPAS